MADTKPVRHEDQVVQAATTAFGELLVEVDRLKDINKYLGDQLTESHAFHGAMIRERDSYQVKYEVLRDVCMALYNARGWAEIEVAFKRLKEVLGLTEEPVEAQENRTYDYQTGWAEDGPIPAGEGDR